MRWLQSAPPSLRPAWPWLVLAVFHLPYAYWLLGILGLTAPGVVRGLVCLVSSLVLLRIQMPSSSNPKNHPQHNPPAATSNILKIGGQVFASLLAVVAAVFSYPFLWFLSLPLSLAAALSFSPQLASYRASWISWLLCIGTFPIEARYSGIIDPLLQYATTAAAAPLIRLTGLPVALRLGDHPQLVTHDLVVSVTNLCASGQTLLASISLAMVLAQVFLHQHLERAALFIGLAPLVSYSGNVLRVVVSTHAANLWAGQAIWPWLHDGIGYVAFLATYGFLFVLAFTLASASRRRTQR